VRRPFQHDLMSVGSVTASMGSPTVFSSLPARRPKVSIIVMNLSTNCANRGYRLAQALGEQFEVELVGTTFGVGTRWGEGIWPPLVGTTITIKAVRGDYLPAYLVSIWRLLKLLDGDVIIACKPRFPSLGIALMRKSLGPQRVILDLDDDELSQTAPGRRASLPKKLAHMGGHFWTRVAHPLHRFADQKFVVSRNFQSRYGGVLVPHPMDPRELDPNRFDGRQIRQRLNIADEMTVVGFIGSPDPQKGVDLIPEAVERLALPNVISMIVGADLQDSYSRELQRRFGKALLLLPVQPIAELPNYLAAADVIALPQRNLPETWGQMPAKLTDAMAMGKPVIAADRADIAAYLEGCGLVFESENVDQLADRIRWVTEHREEARALGRRARARFLTHLSTEVVGDTIRAEVSRLLPRTIERRS